MAKKIRTLIVDDEPIARENLRALLDGDPDVEIVGECGSGAQAVRLIRADAPDLVFLDVQMPEMNGFEVLKRVDPGRIPAIVFVTAYDQYAIKAFEVQALDYLLKPFDDDRFAQALRRAKSHLEQREAAGLRQRLLALLEPDVAEPPAGPRPAYEGKFLVKTASRIFFVKAEEIDWIEAADYYVCLHVGNQRHLLRQTMSEMEAKLDPACFLRIHRSTIVNLSRVTRVMTRPGGEYAVVLADGTSLRLSRGRKEQVEQILNRMV
jgi:two-component system, LytTR family, response regulator